MESYGRIEVDLFPEEINSVNHHDVIRFRHLLEDVAMEYHCRLLYFEIHCGTVTFAFDSDELMANILKILEYEI